MSTQPSRRGLLRGLVAGLLGCAATAAAVTAAQPKTRKVPDTFSGPTVADQTNTEGDTVSVSIGASDPNSGTLTYAAIGLPPGFKINTSTGAITGAVALERKENVKTDAAH